MSGFLVVLSVVAACSAPAAAPATGTSSTGASAVPATASIPAAMPVASVTAVPSATPAGAAGIVYAAIRSGTLRVAFDIAGTETFTPTKGAAVVSMITGTLDISGNDSHLSMRVVSPSGVISQDVVTVGQTRWTGGNDSPWVEADPTCAGIADAIRGAAGVTEIGLTANGRLHRLQLTGLDPTCTIPDIVLDATAAGEVEAFEAASSWVEVHNGVSGKVVLEITGTTAGRAPVVEAPPHPWRQLVDTADRVKLSYPDTWIATVDDGVQTIHDADLGATIVIASVETSADMTVTKWTAHEKESIKKEPGGTVDSVSSMTWNGLNAGLIRVHFTADGRPMFGAAMYTIVPALPGCDSCRPRVIAAYWQSPAGNEAADLKLFLQIAGTASFL